MEQQTLFGGEVARPLASRMRPRTLEEFFGQEKLLGEGKILRQLIDSDNVPSMIFWGPPAWAKPRWRALLPAAPRRNLWIFRP